MNTNIQGSYTPGFMAPQGRGRPREETDIKLLIESLSEGVNSRFDSMSLKQFTKTRINTRPKGVRGLIPRGGYHLEGTSQGAGGTNMLATLKVSDEEDRLFRISWVAALTGVQLELYDPDTGDFADYEDDFGTTADRVRFDWTNIVVNDTDYLVFTNGGDIKYVDGEPAGTITTITGVSAKYITKVENILVAACLTATYNKNQIAYTKAGTFQFYKDTDANYAASSNIITIDGEITQAKTLGDKVCLFTRDDGLWELDLSTGVPRKISEHGTQAPWSVAVGSDFIFWCDYQGIYIKGVDSDNVIKISDDISEIYLSSLQLF